MRQESILMAKIPSNKNSFNNIRDNKTHDSSRKTSVSHTIHRKTAVHDVSHVIIQDYNKVKTFLKQSELEKS